MGQEKEKLDKELFELIEQLKVLYILEKQVWEYHHKNPNFINPITLFEKIKLDKDILEHKINEITLKFNSLN